MKNNFKTQEELDQSLLEFLNSEHPDMIYEVYLDSYNETHLYISRIIFDEETGRFIYKEIAQWDNSIRNYSLYFGYRYSFYNEEQLKYLGKSYQEISLEIDKCDKFGKAHLSHRLLFTYIKIYG